MWCSHCVIKVPVLAQCENNICYDHNKYCFHTVPSTIYHWHFHHTMRTPHLDKACTCKLRIVSQPKSFALQVSLLCMATRNIYWQISNRIENSIDNFSSKRFSLQEVYLNGWKYQYSFHFNCYFGSKNVSNDSLL